MKYVVEIRGDNLDSAWKALDEARNVNVFGAGEGSYTGSGTQDRSLLGLRAEFHAESESEARDFVHTTLAGIEGLEIDLPRATRRD